MMFFIVALIFYRVELDEQGIRVRILGNIKLLPRKVQRVAAKIMMLTQKNSRYIFKIYSGKLVIVWLTMNSFLGQR